MIGGLLKLAVTLIVVELRNELPKLVRGAVRGVKRSLGKKTEKPKPLPVKDIIHIQDQIRRGTSHGVVPRPATAPTPKGDRKP
jgi:hypothetical protein